MRIEYALIMVLISTSPAAAAACPGGLDGTFVQIDDAQLRWSAARWGRALDGLRELGMTTVILQHTGDPYGSYENRYARTLSNILSAADRRDMSVWLGLAHMPGWPHTVPDRFAPLADPRAVGELASLCQASTSCAGFYLSPEIDDSTWSARPAQVRGMLAEAADVLRARVPDARIATAPFFSRALGPDAFARFFAEVVRDTGIDVVLLQGGTGTGRASPEDARAYLRALARAMQGAGIETWLVVELFDQTAGPGVDDRAFAARPASFEAVHGALLPGELAAQRRIAFSVLDYMTGADPRAARLRAGYAAYCRSRVAGGAPPR